MDVIKILEKCEKLHSIYIFSLGNFGSHHIGIVDESEKNAPPKIKMSFHTLEKLKEGKQSNPFNLCTSFVWTIE